MYMHVLLFVFLSSQSVFGPLIFRFVQCGLCRVCGKAVLEYDVPFTRIWMRCVCVLKLPVTTHLFARVGHECAYVYQHVHTH